VHEGIAGQPSWSSYSNMVICMQTSGLQMKMSTTKCNDKHSGGRWICDKLTEPAYLP